MAFGPILLAALAAGVRGDEKSASPPGDAKARPKLTVSPETTHITEPLAADGWPDYFEALNQRHSRGVTPENNSVVLLYGALGPAPGGEEMPPGFFERLGVARPQQDGPYFVDLGVYLAETAGIEPTDPQSSRELDRLIEATQRPWTAEQNPHLAEWLRTNEVPLRIVAEAVQRREYFSPLVSDPESPGLITAPLSGVQQYRALGRALCARAMLRSAHGQLEPAWHDLLTVHRLARLTGRGPTLIEGLVGSAIEAIAVAAEVSLVAHTRPDAHTIAGYRADLERLPPRPRMLEKIDVAERYMYLDAMLRMARGDEDAMRLIEADSFAGRLLARLSLNALDWDAILRIGNKQYDRLAAAARKTDRRERQAALAAELEDAKRQMAQLRDGEALQKLFAQAGNPRAAISQWVGKTTVLLLLPALTQIGIAEDRADQRMRTLNVALALAAYRSDHGGYPERLEALSPRYLPELPQDVFTGESLQYRATAGGYLLYSVGANGEDDGGRDESADPAGDDMAIRVP